MTDSRKHNDGKFGKIASPDTYSPTASADDTALTYYCDNETVDGVEFQSAPNGANLVADMSANFLSRAVDVRKHAAIFGGAQIVVPEDWRVSSTVIGIGGLGDGRPRVERGDAAPHLTIEGAAYVPTSC